MQLTLLVPELLWPEPDDLDTLTNLACPALNTLLTRSRLSSRPPQSLEATLGDAFGQADRIPYAAFRLLGEPERFQEASTTFWLNADPVHLHVHQERMILGDSRSFALDLDEASAFAETLNQHLSDTCRFHVAAADRWYLQLSESAGLDELDMPPLSAVAGRSIERMLPETVQAKGLRTLLNEVQMILHAHPVNQKRESSGHLPINGVWLWGAGTLPERKESDFDGVWSNNALARGLARAAGVSSHPVPKEAAVFFAHAAADTRHLIVLEDLLASVHYENGADYRSALHALEERWFEPLRAALLKGRISQLRIEASTAYATLAWDTARKDQLKFWKRPQTLDTLAKNLANA